MRARVTSLSDFDPGRLDPGRLDPGEEGSSKEHTMRAFFLPLGVVAAMSAANAQICVCTAARAWSAESSTCFEITSILAGDAIDGWCVTPPCTPPARRCGGQSVDHMGAQGPGRPLL